MSASVHLVHKNFIHQNKVIKPKAPRISIYVLVGVEAGFFNQIKKAKHPHLFRGIAAHSSITHYKYMHRFLDIAAFDYGDLDEGDQSVFYWMKKNRETLPPVRFDCGVDDLLIDANRELHADLEREGIPHDYIEYPGRHSWDYWHEHLADTLRFFDQQK